MAITATADMSTDIAAHEQLMYFALRPELYYDSIADVEGTHLTNRGASVTFYITNELAAATTALTETSDVTPVAMGDSTVVLTLVEHGNAVQTTAKLRATSFIELNPVVANVVGYNAGLSVDTIARTAIEAGTNERFAGTATSRTTIGTADNLDGDDVAYVVAKLRGANVQPYGSGLYRAYIHPDVSYDYRGTSGARGWSDPKVNVDPSGIYLGVVGASNGALFMESPRSPLFVNASNDAGATGNIDVYGTLVCGREAIAKAVSFGEDYGADPRLVDSPVTDALRRFKGMGWRHLVKYGIFRQASIYRVESASSIGNNSA